MSEDSWQISGARIEVSRVRRLAEDAARESELEVMRVELESLLDDPEGEPSEDDAIVIEFRSPKGESSLRLAPAEEGMELSLGKKSAGDLAVSYGKLLAKRLQADAEAKPAKKPTKKKADPAGAALDVVTYRAFDYEGKECKKGKFTALVMQSILAGGTSKTHAVLHDQGRMSANVAKLVLVTHDAKGSPLIEHTWACDGYGRITEKVQKDLTKGS